MTLTQLRCFFEVAGTRNFTEAAKNMFVAQSSVSMAIKELETELNVPLFVRRGKRAIELTNYGELLFPYIASSLSTLDEGLALLRSRSNGDTVRVGCFVNVSHSLVPWFLKGFPNKDINISLDIQQTFIDFFPRMLQGEYDLIITTNAENVENCKSVHIATQEICLLVSKNHRFAFRKKVTINDIKDETLCFVAPDSYMDKHIKRMFKEHNLVPRMIYAPDHTILTTEIALGKKIALTTKLPIDDNLLTFIEVDDPLAKRPVYISWPTDRRLSDSAGILLEHILTISRASGADSLLF